MLAARAWPPGCLAPGRDQAHAHLDLAAALAHDCRSAGIAAVETSGVCTAGDARLHSYRHQGRRLVQMLTVWRA